MKKIILGTVGLAVVLLFACKKSNVDVQKEQAAATPLSVGCIVATDTLQGVITTNTTFSSGRNIYIKGLVFVQAPATVTFSPGDLIIGSSGPVAPDTINYANNKGTLIIMQGAKLSSVGTASQPIVWTSNSCTGSKFSGEWGGLVLLGKAPIHTKTGAATNFFEALPQTDPKNVYGGTDANDNSGSVAYNRFEFGGGEVIYPNQEINGVTFCGVGAGTSFHHVEVANAGDDGFEWFGGTINCDHLVDYNPRDDSYDFDEGYRGHLQFIIEYRSHLNDVSGSHGIETDNDANGTAANPHTQPVITNATFVGPIDTIGTVGPGNYYDGEVFIRRNSRLVLVNSLMICQNQRWAFVTTPSTVNLVASTANSLTDSIIVGYNIWQTSSNLAVIKSAIEGNPAVASPAVTDNATLGKLSGLVNSQLLTFAAFKLNPSNLVPLAGSPALSGGVNVSALGFVGTTQRGAILSSDPWTTVGTWLSIAEN